MDIGLGPVKDAGKLFPIGDVIKVQMLYRGTGDDQPIEFLVGDFLERAVEAFKVICGRIARLVVGHADQAEFDLQGRGPDQPRELVFCLDFFRHQVQQGNAQRPDVLTCRHFLIQHHDTFARQHVIGRQVGRQFNRHVGIPRLGAQVLHHLRRI